MGPRLSAPARASCGSRAVRCTVTPVTCPYCGTAYPAREAACPACGGAAAPDPALPVGTPLHAGKFAVGRVLGEGGFGITYQGAHQALRRPVAIKELFPVSLGAVRRGTRVAVPTPQQADFHQARDSALQEAQVVAGCRSRHIVDIHDTFLENDTAYIVMEYLEGQTLQEAIDRQGPLPADRVQAIARDMCEALAEVHGHQLLHRDLKPANILLTRDGRTVLIDFGAARAFRPGRTVQQTQILTEGYAAPEQYSPQARFGPCTDIFSLGATLYHALTGAPPVGALARLLDAARPPVPLPAGLPQPLCTALQQALALGVAARPQTVAEFRAVLLGTRSAPPGAPAAAASLAGPSAGARAAVLVARGTDKLAQGQYRAAMADYDSLPGPYLSGGTKEYRAAMADSDGLGLRPGIVAARQYRAAMADYDQALRLDPDVALRCLSGARQMYRAAMADYDQALRLDPDHAAAYYYRGVAKAHLGQDADAMADYDQALRLKPDDAAVYHIRGAAKARLGQYADAMADYDRALQLEPDDAAAYHNRGEARARLGQYRKAIADYNRALRLEPQDARAYRSRGEANAKLGRQRKAKADYDQALYLEHLS